MQIIVGQSCYSGKRQPARHGVSRKLSPASRSPKEVRSKPQVTRAAGPRSRRRVLAGDRLHGMRNLPDERFEATEDGDPGVARCGGARPWETGS